MAKKSRRSFGTVYASVRRDGTLTGTFGVRWMEGQTRKNKAGFVNEKAAQKFAAETQTHLDDGTLVTQRRGDVGLRHAANEWFAEHSAINLSDHQGNVERYALHIEPYFKDIPLRAVTAARIKTWRAALQKKKAGRAHPSEDHVEKELSPQTINRVLALLRTILNDAVVRDYLPVSPIAKIGRGKYLVKVPETMMETPIKVYADVGRVLETIRTMDRTAGRGRHSLLKAAQGSDPIKAAAAMERLRQQREQKGDPVYPFFATLLYTGMRHGEVCGLHWCDVDFAAGTIFVRFSYGGPTKAKRQRKIPMMPALAPILRVHRQTDPWQTDLVFVNPNSGKMYTENSHLGEILDKAMALAALPKIRLHDLRHTMASHFLMQKAGGLPELQRILGHSTPVITSQTYAHFTDDHLAEAMARLSYNRPESTERTERSTSEIPAEGAQVIEIGAAK